MSQIEVELSDKCFYRLRAALAHDYEGILASVADAVNSELRENGRYSDQVETPEKLSGSWIRFLVDSAKENHRKILERAYDFVPKADK
jgi:hypothetical protein